VVYVDVEHMAGYAALAGADTAGAMSALRAVGLSATATDDGAELTVRVTTR
jgi:hypothetical protein